MKNNDLILERNPEQELLEYKEDSEWSCCLFGSKPNDGIFWRPKKNNEPNWFWRWMQYICFGNKWTKRK